MGGHVDMRSPHRSSSYNVLQGSPPQLLASSYKNLSPSDLVGRLQSIVSKSCSSVVHTVKLYRYPELPRDRDSSTI